MRACPHCAEKSGRQLDRFCSRGRGSVRAATAGTVAPSHLLLKFGKLTTKFETLCKETESLLFQTSAGRRTAREERRDEGRRAAGAGSTAGARGDGAVAVPCCLHRAKKQGCRRQPCALSMLDRFYLTKFGFFGSLGFFFPKKNPKWSMGRSPIYNDSQSEREAEPHISHFSTVGHGAKPHIYSAVPFCQSSSLPAQVHIISAARSTPTEPLFIIRS